MTCKIIQQPIPVRNSISRLSQDKNRCLCLCKLLKIQNVNSLSYTYVTKLLQEFVLGKFSKHLLLRIMVVFENFLLNLLFKIT